MIVNHTYVNSKNYYKVEEVCNELYKRLSNEHITKNYFNGDYSLYSGTAGIIFLLNELNKVLGIDTQELIHNYIKQSKQHIENDLNNLSLFAGITGFNYAISLTNKQTGNYENFINRLDEVFIKNLEKRIDLIKYYKGNNLFEPINKSEYDVINGLAGIARYTLFKKDTNSKMEDLSYKIATYFVNICKDNYYNGNKVKGWISKKIKFDENGNYIYNNINEYNLGLAHGVTGILSILSLYLINNIEVDGQKEIIEEITDWMIKVNSKLNENLWPASIGSNNINFKNNLYCRVAWCYGNPGVSSAMYYAGKALNNVNYIRYSFKIFEDIFSHSLEEWSITSPMLCHGYGGVLEILYRLPLKEKDEYYNFLFDKIIDCLNYDKLFCFNNFDLSNTYDLPGFLMGSSGIVLALLTTIANIDTEWDQVLLIS